MPKRKNLPKVLPASDLGNCAMGYSILADRAVRHDTCMAGPGGVLTARGIRTMSYLTRTRLGKLRFLYGDTRTNHAAEVTTDLEFPQRKRVFLRAFPARAFAERLRQDIDVPPACWPSGTGSGARAAVARCAEPHGGIPRHVLAIFDSLIGSEVQNRRLQ